MSDQDDLDFAEDAVAVFDADSSPRSSTEDEGRSERDEVSVTTLRPDDTVLLVAKEPMTMEMADRIREQWRSLPQKVLVLDSSFEVIVRPQDPPPPELISIRGGVVRQVGPIVDGCRIETDPCIMPSRFHLFGAPQRQGRKHA